MTQDELKLVLEALKDDMTEREMLKMALGTLEAIATSAQARDLVNSTIAAIRRVLAQPEPLTFEQVEDCFPDGYSTEDNGILVSAQWLHDYARSIEAKLKERNA